MEASNCSMEASKDLQIDRLEFFQLAANHFVSYSVTIITIGHAIIII